MKVRNLFAFFFFTLIISVSSKSQDYGRHIELSILFYECQRSGKLPENNRIFWRHDSMLDAGKDVGIDLTGGYYDAGDNVKFNFPAASTITLIAWSGIEFGDAYKKAGQWKYLLEMIKWETDFLLKCHTGKDELYVGVGSGNTDHMHWYPPEFIDYDYPSYKVSAASPGSEVSAETAAALTASSLLFKEEDSEYSATLLKAAKEIYDFADKYRGDYTQATSFYSSFSGYLDELAWGAAWLYRATGEEEYLEKFKAVADKEYAPQDMKKYHGCTGPISWDDKRPGVYALIAQITGDESRIKEACEYCDIIIGSPTTPGGLYYDKNLSIWASNRYAANAAAIVAMVANFLPESDSKRETYIKWVKSQIDYILGDNPAGINYVVGAEDNSPKAVHHRGASGVYDSSDKGAKPEFNIFTLYGALAGGPGGDDSYIDDRSNYQMNEVALDYNAGFQLCLAALLHFGFGEKDSGKILDFDRAWPQKAPKPDITIELDTKTLSISTGSGMLCSSWCISFKSNVEFDNIMDSTPLKKEHPNYTICNKRETNFLDGKGTPQTATVQLYSDEKIKLFEPPSEYEVLCDGFHATYMADHYQYIPENGHLYKVTGKGGPENTVPLFKQSTCWPSFICE